MSDYVEARYCIIVLRQAQLSSRDEARETITDLLNDLSGAGTSHARRGILIAALRPIARSLEQAQWPRASLWAVAEVAAQDWYNEAKG